MKRIAVIFYLILFFSQTLRASEEREPKVLVLIIASDTTDAYIELQKVWRAYMNADPEHFEVYFIRGNPDITSPYEISGNDLVVKSVESYVPGIFDKTVLAMEAMQPRLHEFDFVLRTNLSSFYVFPRLLTFIKELPKKNCYCGVQLHLFNCGNYGTISFVSGAGILLSRDLVELLIQQKEAVFALHAEMPDDVLLGVFFQRNGVTSIPAPRKDFPMLQYWTENKHTIPSDAFHFRAKSNYFLRSPDEPFDEELFINKELLEMFYPKS